MQKYLNYIPLSAQHYCRFLGEQYDFNFVLKGNRLTKLGDFRHDRVNSQFIVSVNKDLNPYQFLITFIHELAHLKVAVDHPRSVKAHGKEWKNAFQYLIQPVLKEDIFPEPLLAALKRHMKNPKAAAGSDPKLWSALQAFNNTENDNTLNSIADGSIFIFRKKQFVKIKKRRTRVLCREQKTKKLYLIPGIADVEQV